MGVNAEIGIGGSVAQNGFAARRGSALWDGSGSGQRGLAPRSPPGTTRPGEPGKDEGVRADIESRGDAACTEYAPGVLASAGPAAVVPGRRLPAPPSPPRPPSTPCAAAHRRFATWRAAAVLVLLAFAAVAAPSAQAAKPGVPQDFSAVAGNGQVTLRWREPDDDGGGTGIDEYNVGYKKNFQLQPFEPTLTLPATARETTVPGLDNGTQYLFDLRAVNNMEAGDWVRVFATPYRPPLAPRELKAVPDDGRVTLTWDPPEDQLITGQSTVIPGSEVVRYEYREYQADDGGLWISTNLVEGVSVTGLINGRQYGFEVRAVNGLGGGTEARVAVRPAARPSVPRNLEAEPGDTLVVLTWDPPADAGGSLVTSYQYRVDDDADWTDTGTLTPEVTIDDLVNGKRYRFEVRAVNTVNAVVGGGEAAMVWETPAARPSVPLNLKAEPGDTLVMLTWEPPSDFGGSHITHYEYRVDGSSGSWTGTGTTAPEATVTDLANGRQYEFEVRAVNAVGEGPAVSRRATPVAAPSAPRNLDAEPGDLKVTLTWEAPLNDGGPAVTHYEVRVDGMGEWKNTGQAERWPVTGLMNGRPYGFEVRAVNSAGEGEAATITATPAETPSAPLNLTATPGDGQVTLTWEAPSSDGGSPVLRYEYRVDGRGEWTDIGTDLSVTVPDLTNLQRYTFEVRAVNASGPGEAARKTTTPAETPSAPLNLIATPGDGEVTLEWEVPSSDDGSPVLRYEYRVDGRGEWTDIGTDLSVTVPDLTNLQLYTFHVRAVNEQGAGETATAAATPAMTPSAPRNLMATPGDEQVTLNWEAPASDGGSPIRRYEYRVGESGSWTSTGQVPEATITALTNGQPHTFEVRAVNAQGGGEAATAVATPALTPSAPLNLSVKPGDEEVILTWDAPQSDGGAAILRYEYRVDGSGSWTSTGTNLYAAVTGLTNGRQYAFEVRAVNTTGADKAATVTATPVSVLAAPRNLSATPGDERVTLAWDAPPNEGGSAITGYEYRVDGRGEWTDIGTDLSVTVTGLVNGRSYRFEVRAVNAQGEGAAATVPATPVPGPPGRPSGLTATPDGSSRIELSWSAPSDSGESVIAGYRIDVSDDGGTGWNVLVASTNSPSTTYTHTGLAGGSTRQYRVFAVNASGAGGPSGVSGATTDTGPPSAPLGLRVTPGDGRVTLAWEAPSSDGGSAVTGYQHRSGDSSRWIAVMGTARRATVAGLTNGREYGFEVRAVNALGAGAAVMVNVTVGRIDKVAGTWMGGFGRAAAEHALGGVRQRLVGPRKRVVTVRLAGRTLGGGLRSGSGGTRAWQEDLATLLRGAGGGVEDRGREIALDGRDLLAGSSFALSRRTAGGGFAGVWGSVAHSGIARASGPISVDGGVTTMTLGADYERGPWTAGLAIARSVGDGSYAGSSGRGSVESSLIGMYPYVTREVTDRLSAWGSVGYAQGTLALAPAGGATMETDLDLTMAAAGTRSEVLTVAETGSYELALETDGLWVRTTADAAPGIPAVETGITRLRLGLERTRVTRLRNRGELTGSVEVGVRRDGGDAESGFGADIGGGVSYAHRRGVFTAAVSGRMLVAHEDSDLRDWGVSGSFVFDRQPGSRRDLVLSLRPSVGSPASNGMAALLGRETMVGTARDADPTRDGRLEAEIAYGLPISGGRFVGMPYARLGLAEAGQDYRLGWRVESGRRHQRLSVDIGVAMRHRAHAGDVPEDRVGLDLALRW